MTSNKSCIVFLNKNIKSKIILGYWKILNFEGKGIIGVKTIDDNEKYIHDVFYILALIQIFLSVGS